MEQAILAEQRGADYLGVGAVFHTGSKADAEDVSHETLTAICNAVKIPVIAIGGITRDNVTELSGSGICGIAVISAIFAQKDIVSATKDLKEQILRMLEKQIILRNHSSSHQAADWGGTTFFCRLSKKKSNAKE